MAALEELEAAYAVAQADPAFHAELDTLLRDYCGRPTPLYFAKRLSAHLGGAKIYLKREDLLHTGAHKINNALGQGLLARRMGKQRIIAETGAGQHGVATATVCALLGLECVHLHGRGGHAAPGAQRLPHAPARCRGPPRHRRLRHPQGRHQRGHARLGHQRPHHLLHPRQRPRRASLPHHGPRLPARHQPRSPARRSSTAEGKLPTAIIACVGGGSNAIGAFYEFLPDANVQLIGVEGGGRGTGLGEHAARFQKIGGGTPGVLQGTYSYVLQDDAGQVSSTHSVSAGLDYASVGPEHAMLHDTGRATYTSATDQAALDAAVALSRTEGILPALESAHAIAEAIRLAPTLSPTDVLMVNLSGRGDKDLGILARELNLKGAKSSL